jgi:hypothetical protein
MGRFMGRLQASPNILPCMCARVCAHVTGRVRGRPYTASGHTGGGWARTHMFSRSTSMHEDGACKRKYSTQMCTHKHHRHARVYPGLHT